MNCHPFTSGSLLILIIESMHSSINVSSTVNFFLGDRKNPRYLSSFLLCWKEQLFNVFIVMTTDFLGVQRWYHRHQVLENNQLFVECMGETFL